MTLKIPVGRIGQWKHPKYGTIKMSQQTFNDMRRNFKSKIPKFTPYIRVGHDRAETAGLNTSLPEGWITDLVQEGDVLYALADPIGPHVAEMVKTKKFRYSSPEYQDNYLENGSNVGAVILALSLTNEPFLTRLPESRLLADPADTIYLDYSNHEDGARKLAEDVRQLADESMLELGYQIVDGKYTLSDGAEPGSTEGLNIKKELNHGQVDKGTTSMADEAMIALGYRVVDGKYVR